MEIEVKIRPEKMDEVEHIDYIQFDELAVSPTVSGYDAGFVYMGDVEIGDADASGKISQLLTKVVSEIQFCDKNGDEILIEEDQVCDYVDKMIFDDNGKYFEYVPILINQNAAWRRCKNA